MAETYSYYNGSRLPDKVPTERRSKPETNYGVFSFILWMTSVGLVALGIFMTGEGLVQDGKLVLDGAYLYIALITYLAGFILWMVSLTLAGAGLASGRGGLGALLTLAFSFLPVLFFGLSMLTGWIPDALLDMSGINDIGQPEPDLTNMESDPDWPY